MASLERLAITGPSRDVAVTVIGGGATGVELAGTHAGCRSAVVQLPRHLRVRGTLAWLALHLVTLLGGRNRVSALVNLSWRYLTWRRGGGLIVGDDPPAETGL